MPPAEPEKPSRINLKRFALRAGIALLLVLLGTCLVSVDETEFVIVERLGTISAVYDTPESRGLQFKLPWPIETVRRFDRRVQLFDPPGREVFTRDKKNISVNAYLTWQIAAWDGTGASVSDHPVVRFYRSLGSKEIAEARLETRLRSVLTTVVGQVDLDHLLEVESPESGPLLPDGGLLAKLSTDIAGAIRQRGDEAVPITEQLGIEIIESRVRRLNFPEGNRQSVYDRMKSERRKIAERYRSAGQADSQMIRSRADRLYAELVARADADAERIRGRADAEALQVLNEAHQLDPEFYRTIRTLDAYRKFINEKTTLVLSSSSRLLELLTKGVPEVSPVPKPDLHGPIVAPKPETAGHQLPAEVPDPSASKGATP
jgi:modulator of FtsH protease HflC